MKTPANPEPKPKPKSEARFLIAVLLKALLLLVVIGGLILLLNPSRSLGRISLYNNLFPGRERFPHGENPQRSYNMTINDLDAMFASHVITREKDADEFRVIVLGDSSVWGTLLPNDQTLAGLLNARALKTCDGRRVVIYNLGYPTISLQKDALILNRAMAFEPDLILWPFTLESFPGMNPSTSPLLGNNREEVNRLFPGSQPDPDRGSLWDQIQKERRGLADWIRYQLYGVMWAATGIDQDFAQAWQPAQRDFEPDSTFNKQERFDLPSRLDFSPIETGLKLAGDIPVWLVNEPILISTGENSEIRYNFFYPRWVFDEFRGAVQSRADAAGWTYFDLWNLVPEAEFTNSAIHLTPAGEALLADRLAEEIESRLFCE